MSKLSLTYMDTPVGAKENSVLTTEEKQPFVDLNQLTKELTYKHYGSAGEHNQFVLGGTQTIFPDEPQAQNMGLWSKTMSSAAGVFETPLVLTTTLNALYKSVGVSFAFVDGYCDQLNIKWYRDSMLLSQKDFAPNSEQFFCQNNVENFNKVVITFDRYTRPFTYLKLKSLEYGVIRVFGEDELKDVSVIEEISPISEEITINTLDFILKPKANTDFIFQSKQGIKLEFGGHLKGLYFIEQSKRTASNIYNINTVDYIGLMDKTSFMGGMYQNKDAYELAGEIFGKIPFEMGENLKNKTVTGYLPIDSQRSSLMQLAFAIGAAVSTTQSDKVRIFSLDSEIKGDFPKGKVFYGQEFDDIDGVTEVRITQHQYVKSNETQELFSGSTGRQMVRFGEPMWGLTITNGSIIKADVNHAIISANANCVLIGKKYNHNTVVVEKKNPIVSAADLENVITFDNATLISSSNVNEMIQKVYNYYMKRNSTNMKLIIDSCKVGDMISYDAEYLGKKQGVITSMRYGLNGNEIVADCEVADVDI